PRVQVVGVSPDADLERRGDVDLDEAPAQAPREPPRLGVWRDEGRNHEDPVALETAGEETRALHVIVAVGAREAGLGEELTDALSVEGVDLAAAPSELGAKRLGERRLARARQPGQPDHRRLEGLPPELDPVPEP